MEQLKTEDLKNYVEQQLKWDNRIADQDIEIDVTDHKVVLKGSVPDYASYIAAENDVYMIEGIHEVNNRLNIIYPPAFEVPDDEEIKEKVEKMIEWDSSIRSEDIRVEADKGIIKLNGSTETVWEADVIERLARAVNGVQGVINHITINAPRDDYTDEHIRQQLEKSFKYNAVLMDKDIHVNVQEGVVELYGKVDHWFEMDTAYRMCIYTSGVRDVINELEIGDKKR